MSFLSEKIVLYLDCEQVAVAEYGDDTPGQIGPNGNVTLARSERTDKKKVATVAKTLFTQVLVTLAPLVQPHAITNYL